MGLNREAFTAPLAEHASVSALQAVSPPGRRTNGTVGGATWAALDPGMSLAPPCRRHRFRVKCSLGPHRPC